MFASESYEPIKKAYFINKRVISIPCYPHGYFFVLQFNWKTAVES